MVRGGRGGCGGDLSGVMAKGFVGGTATGMCGLSIPEFDHHGECIHVHRQEGCLGASTRMSRSGIAHDTETRVDMKA